MVSIVMEGITFIDLISSPPGSTIFVLILAIFLSLGTTLLTRLLTDPQETARKQAIIKEHQTEKKELETLQKENPSRYAKELIRWKRREKAVQKMQQNMSLSRMKPTCITFVPMIVIFYLLNGIYNPTIGGTAITMPVALPAMNPSIIPLLGDYVGATKLGGAINFMAWYFLCSFCMNSVIQRIFGVAQQTSLSQMLGGGQEGSGFSTKDLFRKKP